MHLLGTGGVLALVSRIAAVIVVGLTTKDASETGLLAVAVDQGDCVSEYHYESLRTSLPIGNDSILL
ncbi:MAG TPA: hypothetical protein VIM37_01780 [Candidatus Microsaccharimonas sp.]